MIKLCLSLSLLVAVAYGIPFPQGTPTVPNTPPGPEHSVPASYPQGPPPGPNGIHPPCMPPPPPPGQGPPQGPPPAGFQGPPPGGLPMPGPNGLPPQNLPLCSPTLVSGHCGGKTYFWDTAKESEPEEFKKCFFSDGPVSALCNGKEYTWDPAKDAKPADLESCEKEFLAKQAAQG